MKPDIPRQSATFAVRLALLSLVLSAAAPGQRAPSNYIGVIHQGPDLLLELTAGAAGSADRVELRLNKATVRGAELAFGPAGWTASGDGANLALEGPRLERFPALFRIAIGDAKTPPVTRVRISAVGVKVSDRDLPLVQAAAPAVSAGLEGLAALPAIVFQGESILARILIPRATPSLGTWYFDNRASEPLGEAIRITIPFEAEGETVLPARFLDPFGRTVVEGEARFLVEPSPDFLKRPRVEGVQPLALAGEALMVCGWFPPASRSGVLLDGKPNLEAVAGSARSLVFTLPEETPPGRHLVSGDPAAGFPDAIVAFQTIKLETTVDRAEPPQVRIRAIGTEAPVRVRVVNLNPFAASLEGGESQVVETDGGRENLAMIPLRPSENPSVAAPKLDIAFTLAGGREACVSQGDLPASPAARRVAN